MLLSLYEFHFQTLVGVHHFRQPSVVVFLGITLAFVLFKFFLLNLIELFLGVLFKFLDYFDEVMTFNF